MAHEIEEPQIRYETVRVTVALARRWLQKNHPNNRTLNQNAVDRFVEAIKSGNWDLNHQGIAFDSKGLLIDGQHRLTALVVAADGMSKADEKKLSVLMSVAHYPEGLNVRFVDRGTTRKHGNMLEMAGIVEKGFGNKASAMGRSLLCLSRNMVTCPDYEAVAHKLMEKSLPDMIQLHEGCGRWRVSSHVLSALIYALPVDRAAIAELAKKVKMNDGLEVHSGGWHLRKIVDKEHEGVGRTNGVTVSMMVLQCIRLHLSGESRKIIKINREMNGEVVVPEALQYFQRQRARVGVGAEVF